MVLRWIENCVLEVRMEKQRQVFREDEKVEADGVEVGEKEVVESKKSDIIIMVSLMKKKEAWEEIEKERLGKICF